MQTIVLSFVVDWSPWMNFRFESQRSTELEVCLGAHSSLLCIESRTRICFSLSGIPWESSQELHPCSSTRLIFLIFLHFNLSSSVYSSSFVTKQVVDKNLFAKETKVWNWRRPLSLPILCYRVRFFSSIEPSLSFQRKLQFSWKAGLTLSLNEEARETLLMIFGMKVLLLFLSWWRSLLWFRRCSASPFNPNEWM
jgi:hypothetical protein